MRDARVGMLPPKLAQTIINLATGPNDKRPATILDPFCGTGVILQEAVLMGYDIYGTDLEERMVRYSHENLQWLKETHKLSFSERLDVGDVTSHQWHPPIDAVAAETYLGRPLSRMLPHDELLDIVQSVNTLHKKALQNIHRQLPPNTRLCLAVPAWRTPKGFLPLPVLDQLDKMGYNQLVFSHVNAQNIRYVRDNQFVARQLIVLTTK